MEGESIMPYTPLTVNIRENHLKQHRNLWWVVDDEIKSKFLRGFLQGWRRLSEKYPWLGLGALYPKRTPPEVLQIEKQLRNRLSFPIDPWSSIISQTAQVKTICEVIAQELNWPNCNFIPDDPLKCVFFTADGSDISWIVDIIKDKVSKHVNEEEFLRILREKIHLKELILYVLVEGKRNEIGHFI